MLARTNGSGRFTLKQLREPYLIRVCSESVSGGGGGHRAQRSGECDQESSKRFTPSYLGPDGNLNSWMRHTRFFRPQLPHRSLGRVVVQPPAVVTGTWKDGANRLLYLTRIDGSIAAQTITDGKGHYRFEVAPGPYRIEADRDEGLHTDSTVPGYLSKRLLLRAGRTAHVTFKTRHAGIVRGLVEHQRRPAPRPVPRDPRQGRRLRRRRGHQRDRPLRRQLAQAGSLHRHDVVRRVGVRPEVADRRGRPEDRRHRRPGARPGPLGELLRGRRRLPGRQRLGRRRAPQRRRPGGQGLPGQPAARARRGRHLQRPPDEHLQRSTCAAARSRPTAPSRSTSRGSRRPGRPGEQRQPRPGPAPAQPADHEPHRHPAQGRPGQAHRRPRGQLAAAVARRRRPGHPDGAQLDRAVRGRRLHRPRHRPGHLRRGGDHRPQGARRQADHHRAPTSPPPTRR